MGGCCSGLVGVDFGFEFGRVSTSCTMIRDRCEM